MSDEKTTAKAAWDAERAVLAREDPDWKMPSWSRAPAWRRRHYIMEARDAAKLLTN